MQAFSRTESPRARTDSLHFGAVVRHKRLAKGLGLRRFAQLVGVSPTYVSLVEQGKADPPTADRARRMAELLDEPADALITLAGRMPDDLQGIIRAQPLELSAFLREAPGLTRGQLQRLVEQARQWNAENRRPQ